MKTLTSDEAKTFWETEAQQRPMSFRGVGKFTVIADRNIFGVFPCVHTAASFDVIWEEMITTQRGVVAATIH